MKQKITKARILIGIAVLAVVGILIGAVVYSSTRQAWKEARLEELQPSLTPTLTPTVTPTPTLSPTPTVTPTPTASPTPTLSPTPTPTPLPPVEDLIKAAMVINQTRGEVYYAYRDQEILTPASVTKLMTALLALERGNLEDVLTATAVSFDLGCPDASLCGFELGDQATLEETLYGLLLPSGNEAAHMVAEYISGDVPTFVALMNQRAAELGMVNTTFCNPHGLPNDGHLTTAYDMSLVMKALLEHEKFFEIAENGRYDVEITNSRGETETLKMHNSNFYLRGAKKIPEGIEILGGKTGYTEKAGRCLVMFVTGLNGDLYLVEAFGAENTDKLYMAMDQLLGMTE